MSITAASVPIAAMAMLVPVYVIIDTGGTKKEYSHFWAGLLRFSRENSYGSLMSRKG